MTRNYFKSSYSCKIVRSSSHSFVTTSQTKSTTFSVRMVKSSRQFVHDETFSWLHVHCRSFKTQFRRIFTRINNTFFPFIQHIKCFVRDDRQGKYQMLFMSFYETPNDVFNKLFHHSSLPNSSVEVARIFKVHLKLFKFSIGMICHGKIA